MKKNVPEISFCYDIEQSTQKFVDFFYDKPCFKQGILRDHPDLKEVSLISREEGEPYIRGYASQYLYENDNKIHNFISAVKQDFEINGIKALVLLSDIMEHDFHDGFNSFTVIPNITGFTPFSIARKTIYLSTSAFVNVQKAYEKKRLATTAIIVHEICHFIFRKQLSTLPISKESDDIVHLVQEVLAPVTMNQPELKDILSLRDYWGNSYLKPIIFHTKKGDINMVDFTSALYSEMHTEGKSFVQFIVRLFEIFTSVHLELCQRMNYWHNYGTEIFKDAVLSEKYSKPIDLAN